MTSEELEEKKKKEANYNFFQRWNTYQKERFPLAVFSVYIFCLTWATFFFNKNLNTLLDKTVNVGVFVLMFVVAIAQFLMARIVDEFKDYAEDAKYRPYRPVPRGLIKLKELRVLLFMCAGIQITLTCIFNIAGLKYLALVWLFFLLMTKSFFIKKFIDKHILIEVLLDEIMLPLLILYLSSFVGLTFANIWPLLAMVYFVSWIIEIARKMRCKADEEKGVKTYTAVLGIPRATILISVLELLLLVSRILLPSKLNTGNDMAKIVLSVIYALLMAINVGFVAKKTRSLAKCVEYLGDAFVMIICLSVICI